MTAEPVLATIPHWAVTLNDGPIHHRDCRCMGCVEQVDEHARDLDAFTRPFDFDAETDRLPALVERTDNETVLYAGRLNSVFGVPGSGKSWVAIVAILEAVFRGGHVLYWDHEDTPQTFKRRSVMLGFDPLVHGGAFKYVIPSLAQSPIAIEEAKSWLASAPDPTHSLVVIDATDYLSSAILAAVADAGEVKGVRSLRGMVKGGNSAIDAAIKNLVDLGMLAKNREGKTDIYTVTGQGSMLLETDD